MRMLDVRTFDAWLADQTDLSCVTNWETTTPVVGLTSITVITGASDSPIDVTNRPHAKLIEENDLKFSMAHQNTSVVGYLVQNAFRIDTDIDCKVVGSDDPNRRVFESEHLIEGDSKPVCLDHPIHCDGLPDGQTPRLSISGTLRVFVPGVGERFTVLSQREFAVNYSN